MLKYYRLIFVAVLVSCSFACKLNYSITAGYINYGRVSNYFDDSVSVRIRLPGDFSFVEQKARIKESALLFEPSQILFVTTWKNQNNYKVIGLAYSKVIDLESFTNSMLKKISNLKQVENARKIHPINDPFHTNYTIPLSEDSTKVRLLTYSLLIDHQKQQVIEEYIINPTMGTAIRLVWLSKNKDDNYSAQKITSLYQNASAAMNSIVFYSKKPSLFSFAISNFNREEGYNYILPLTLLGNKMQKFMSSSFQDKSTFIQSYVTFTSMAGQYEEARRFDSKLYKTRSDSIDNIRIKDFHQVSAQKYIVETARSHQIIMLNEIHHWPQCRALIRDMLAELKAEGYNKLALEALDNNRISQNYNKVPTQTDGLYTSEPVYAQLIREARRLGMEIFAYEDTVVCDSKDYNVRANQREKNEALNIANYLKNHSLANGKLIVVAGYDHIKKQRTGNITPMAKRLCDSLNVIPACFDLTSYYEKEIVANQSAVYNYAMNKNIDKEPIIMIDDNHNAFVPQKSIGFVDACVFLPPGNLDGNNFPNWFRQKNALPVTIAFKKKANRKAFLQVFLKDEIAEVDGDAVPFLNHTIESGTANITVPLTPGTGYVYWLKDYFTNKTIEFGKINPNTK